MISSSTVKGKYAVIPQKTNIASNFATTVPTNLNYTSSDLVTAGAGGVNSGQIDVSLSGDSAPNPKFIKFSVSSLLLDSSSIYADPTKWAKVSTIVTSVEPNESIHFSASVSMFNWGQAELRAFVKDSEGNVLSETVVKKPSSYPNSNYAQSISVTWTNNLGEATNAYVEIRGWANTNGYSSHYTIPTTNVIKIFVDYHTGFIGNAGFIYGDYASNNRLEGSFGNDPIKANFSKTLVAANPTNYLIGSYRSIPRTSVKLFSFDGVTPDVFPAGTDFLIGVSEKGRAIVEKSFTVDFNISEIYFYPTSAEGTTDEKPGIIRVYPIGLPGSYGSVEVVGLNSQRNQVSIPLKLNNNKRGFVVDAFDPSLNPNNYCEFSGRLVIKGAPIVVNTLSKI